MNHTIERTIEIELSPEEAGQWFARQPSDAQAAFFEHAAVEMDNLCRGAQYDVDRQWSYVGQSLAEDHPVQAGRYGHGREMLNAIKSHMDEYITNPSPRGELKHE